MIDLEWMAWTLPTASFFIVIALILTAMTAWQLVAPSAPRQGFLPLVTTPGDRLFIGLLSSAYIHLAWLGLTELNVFFALAISIVWLIAVMRWG